MTERRRWSNSYYFAFNNEDAADYLYYFYIELATLSLEIMTYTDIEVQTQ